MAVLLHPLLRLQRAAQRVGQQLRAVEHGAEAQVLVLGDRIVPGQPALSVFDEKFDEEDTNCVTSR